MAAYRASVSDNGEIIVHRPLTATDGPPRQQQAPSEAMPHMTTKTYLATNTPDGVDVQVTPRSVSSRSAPRPTGMIASATDKLGMPQAPHEVTENSLVRTSYGQFTVGSLLASGELVRLPSGQIVEPGAEGTGEAEAGEPEEPASTNDEEGDDPGEALPDQKAERLVSALAEHTTAGTQVAVIQDLANSGEVSEATLIKAASELRVDPERAQELLGMARAGFEAQVRSVIEGMGLDSDDVLDWAWEHNAKGMGEAVKRIAMDRSTAGFRALAQSYMANLDTIDADAILEADFGPGISARKNDDGRVILKTKTHGEVSWPVAVSMGLVKVGRGR